MEDSKKRPAAPCGLSFANLLERSRRHTQACYLLFRLPADKSVNCLCGFNISASFLSVAE